MSDYEIYPFEETMNALFDIKRQHERGEELKWTGPDRLHHMVSAGCPEPSWNFSPEGLAYYEEHERDFDEVWAMVCFQIGVHNGAVRENQPRWNRDTRIKLMAISLHEELADPDKDWPDYLGMAERIIDQDYWT